MNDESREPTAPTSPATSTDPAPPPPPPSPGTSTEKASGGMRALGIVLALVLLFGAAVMIVAAGEIADTPTAEEVTSGEEQLPSDGKVFDGSEGKRSVTTALMYASGVVGAIAVIRLRLRDHRHPRAPVRAGRDRRGDPRRYRARHLGIRSAGPARRGRAGSPPGPTGPEYTRGVAAEELRPAYLITGSDTAKIDAAVARLRLRAEREGGPGALEVFPAPPGGAPDAAALIAAIPAMSLTAGRRYLLADGVERWTAKQAAPVIEALSRSAPGPHFRPRRSRGAAEGARAQGPRRRGRRGRGRRAVTSRRPKTRQLPAWLAAEAERRGLSIDADAARLLVERMGEHRPPLAPSSTASPPGRAAGGSGRARGPRGDDRRHLRGGGMGPRRRAPAARPSAALGAAERLAGQGEAVTPLVYGVAKRLRKAHQALRARGRQAGQGGRGLAADAPYAAKMLVSAVRDTSVDEVRSADLRGGRPRVVDARRVRLPRGGRADAGRPPCGRRTRLSAGWRGRRCGPRGPRAGDEASGRATSCARRCWRAERRVCDGLVDRGIQLSSARQRAVRVAGGDGLLEPAEVRLDRAGDAPVLDALALGVRAIRFFCEAILAIGPTAQCSGERGPRARLERPDGVGRIRRRRRQPRRGGDGRRHRPRSRAAERAAPPGDEPLAGRDGSPARPRSSAAATGLSRVAGLVREIFAACYFGVGRRCRRSRSPS